MSHFTVEEHFQDAGWFPDPVLAPTGQSPFKLTAKRYLPKAKVPIAKDAFILIFCHCAGARAYFTFFFLLYLLLFIYVYEPFW